MRFKENSKQNDKKMNREKIIEISKETKSNLEKSFKNTNHLKPFHLNRIDEIEDSLNSTLIDQAFDLQDQIKNTVISILKLTELNISRYFLEIIIKDSIPRLEMASNLCEDLASMYIRENMSNESFKKERLHGILTDKLKTISTSDIDSNGKLVGRKLHKLKAYIEAMIRSKIISCRSRWIISLSLQSSFFAPRKSDSIWIDKMIKEINTLLNDKEMINATLIFDSPDLLKNHQSINLFRDEKAGLSLFVMNAYSIALLDKDSKDFTNKGFPVCAKPLMSKTLQTLQALHTTESYFTEISLDEIEKIIKSSFSDDPDYNFKYPNPTKK